MIGTPEKYYLSWKEDSSIENPLDRAITQLCNRERLLETSGGKRRWHGAGYGAQLHAR